MASIVPSQDGVHQIEWTPNRGPQTLLFKCPADIILFGGAAGGGKTEGAIMWAAEHVDKDAYHSVIFRKTFPELERQVIERSRHIFTGIGFYNESKHVWKFKTPVPAGMRTGVGGHAILEFAYLEKEGDVFKYQGAEFARIVFEESTMFSEHQVRYMLSRNRSPVEGIRRQMLLTTNPVGPGFGWHKKLFIENRKPYEIYKDARWSLDNKPTEHSTVFIPAKVQDNPVLLKRDPDYPKKLRTQFGVIADALLEGSWDSPMNLALDINEDLHFVEPFVVKTYSRRWMGIDWGKKDTAACIWFAYDGNRVYCYRDHCRPGREIIPYAQELIQLSMGTDEEGMPKMEKIEFAVLSHECFADRGMGNTQADQFSQVFMEAGIPLIRSDKDPEGRLLLIREFLRNDPGVKVVVGSAEEDFEYWINRFQREGVGAMAEYKRSVGSQQTSELPKMKIFRRIEDSPFGETYGCPGLVKTLPTLVVDVEKPRKIAENQEDDPFDALGYGLKAYAAGITKPAELFYEELMDGRIPDSGMAAHFAMKEARKRAGEAGSGPLRWKKAKYRG